MGRLMCRNDWDKSSTQEKNSTRLKVVRAKYSKNFGNRKKTADFHRTARNL